MAFNDDFLYVQKEKDGTFTVWCEMLAIDASCVTIEEVEAAIETGIARARTVPPELGMMLAKLRDRKAARDILLKQLEAVRKDITTIEQQIDAYDYNTSTPQMAELLKECQDRLKAEIQAFNPDSPMAKHFGEPPVYVAMVERIDYDRDGDPDLTVLISWSRRPKE